MDPGLDVPANERRALDATLADQAELVGAVAVAGAAVDTLLAQARTVADALRARPDAQPDLADAATRIQAQAEALRVVLEGPGEGGVAQQETVLPLSSLVNRLYTTTEAWTGRPTADQLRLTRLARQQASGLVDALTELVGEDLPALRKALSDAGIPWPAGTAPALPNQLTPSREP